MVFYFTNMPLTKITVMIKHICVAHLLIVYMNIHVQPNKDTLFKRSYSY